MMFTAGSELLSIAGYDAITVGNNEGFAGIEVTETLATSGSTKFLSCNLYKINGNLNENNINNLIPLEGVKRSIIVEKNGVRFLTIGTSSYGEYDEFYNLCGLQSTDAIKEIRAEIKENKN